MSLRIHDPSKVNATVATFLDFIKRVTITTVFSVGHTYLYDARVHRVDTIVTDTLTDKGTPTVTADSDLSTDDKMPDKRSDNYLRNCRVPPKFHSWVK